MISGMSQVQINLEVDKGYMELAQVLHQSPWQPGFFAHYSGYHIPKFISGRC